MQTLLGVIFLLIALGCHLIIVVSAFKDDIWKGVATLLCGCYELYYAIFEFDMEYKWWIVLGYLFAGGIASTLLNAAGYYHGAPAYR